MELRTTNYKLRTAHYELPTANHELDLYRQRPDKTYSMTGCMPMVVCRERGITGVLTYDSDFEQEGSWRCCEARDRKEHRMAVTLVPEEIEAYAAAHTTPLPPLLDELAAATQDTTRDASHGTGAKNGSVGAPRRCEV